MNELPIATNDQLEQMHKIAEKKYGAQINQEVIEEQAAPESIEEQSVGESTTQQEQETQAASESEPNIQPKQEQSKASSESFREIRERALKAEREKELLMRFITERIPQQQQPQHAAVVPQEEDLELTIAPDELAEGKHLVKLTKKIKQLESQIKKGTQESFALSTESRLKANYPDFEKVVSQSNVAALSELYPEIAKTIGESSDLYNKAVSAYTMIKKFGIHKDDPFIDDKIKVQQNAVKPRPLASLSPQQGESPLSKANAFANGLTPDLAKQLWKETKEAMKNG